MASETPNLFKTIQMEWIGPQPCRGLVFTTLIIHACYYLELRTAITIYGLALIIRHSIIRNLDYMMYFLSTKLSSVNLLRYYDCDACNTTYFRPDMSCMHAMWWDPH